MKKLLSLLVLVTVFSFSPSTNIMISYADKHDMVSPSPATEEQGFKWTWISNEICVQMTPMESTSPEQLRRLQGAGLTTIWHVPDSNGRKAKSRDTYNGTWSQDESGIWSFVFDDYTIPVGLTKIDGVLYAFTGYGELKEGYEYWNGQKTGADGVVSENSAEFLEYLAAQYLPECTTQITE